MPARFRRTRLALRTSQSVCRPRPPRRAGGGRTQPDLPYPSRVSKYMSSAWHSVVTPPDSFVTLNEDRDAEPFLQLYDRRHAGYAADGYARGLMYIGIASKGNLTSPCSAVSNPTKIIQKKKKTWTPAAPGPIPSSHRAIMCAWQPSVGFGAGHVVIQDVLGNLGNHNIRGDVWDPDALEHPVDGGASRRASARRSVVRCSLVVVTVGRRGRGLRGCWAVGRVRTRWRRDTRAVSGGVAVQGRVSHGVGGLSACLTKERKAGKGRKMKRSVRP